MADIELVIKVPEHCLEELKRIELNESNEGVVFHTIKCILNGTPIPKGHGRLIDADAYFADVKKHYFDNDTVMRCTEIALSNAPTIIEADKIEPLTNGDWHYGSEPMQNISYSDRTTIIGANRSEE